MKKHQLPHFQPFFRIQESMRDDTTQCVHIAAQTVRDMTERGLFHLDSVVIQLSSEDAIVSIHLQLTSDRPQPDSPGFPISGFPRQLADADTLKRPRECIINSCTMLSD